MICQVKPVKNLAAKKAAAETTFAKPERAGQPDAFAWSYYTAGPYLVPVTRWIE